MSNASQNQAADVDIYCAAVDSCADWADTTNTSTGRVGYRLRTTAKVRHQFGATAWAANEWYDTPDFSNVVQEVSDRAGRNETFDLGVMMLPYSTDLPVANCRRIVYSYDQTGNTSGAKLTYTYTVPGGNIASVVAHQRLLGGM
jgi:hypothetical protein